MSEIGQGESHGISVRRIEVTCGPHAQKRRGSHMAVVARAKVLGSLPLYAEDLHGAVEQRGYRLGRHEMWDEYVVPLNPELEDQDWFESRRRENSLRHFNERWEQAKENRLTQELFDADPIYLELPVRERTLLRCPVCKATIAVANADELREVVRKLALAGAESVDLSTVGRALALQKNA